MPRHALLLVLALTAISCASSRLAVKDVAEVAQSPAREWKKVAAGAAITGAALLVDDELARIARNNDSHVLDEFTRAVEPLGGGASDKVMAAFLLYGVAAKNQRARAVAFDSIVSSVIASKAITPALKQLTGRERPNGSDDEESFPSNHATQAFALAGVISTHYRDRPWVPWVAYGLATGVGVSRVYHDAHWTSDVVAGAMIGAFVGTTVAKTNRSERLTWSVKPVRGGAMVSLKW
jgi:hypothetical protein